MGLSSHNLIPLPPDFLTVWKDDILRVKELYRERKYRRCAVLCSELLATAKHPLHRTFLFFYQAICYESLGHISHIYSSNKVPLLEQARDAFSSAKDLLPLPYLTTADGGYDDPKFSPVCPTQEVLDLYAASPSFYGSPDAFHEQGSAHTMASPIVRAAEYHQSKEGSKRNVTTNSADLGFEKCVTTDLTLDRDLLSLRPKTESQHKAKLSRSLSSKHSLADELVPSPLFSRGPASKKEASFEILPDTLSLPLVALSKPLPVTPISRPLPALPFHKNAQFIFKGKRLILVPKRKTALATLISRFEETSPFDSPSTIATSQDLVLRNRNPTPATERFNRISATFVEKLADIDDQDKENIFPLEMQNISRHIMKPHCPATPIHIPETTPSKQPECLHPITHAPQLTAYNTHLSTFRTSIQTHLSTVTQMITKTQETQLMHDQEKRQAFAATYSKNISDNQNQANQHPTKDVRLRSFWSLQIATAEAQNKPGSIGSSTTKSTMTDAAEEQRRVKLCERIAKLKAQGWDVGLRVGKRGWKGSEYYESFREEVKREIAILEMERESKMKMQV